MKPRAQTPGGKKTKTFRRFTAAEKVSRVVLLPRLDRNAFHSHKISLLALWLQSGLWILTAKGVGVSLSQRAICSKVAAD